MITLQEIEKLANLSRIAVTSEEKEQLRKDMESILSYVEQVNAVSADLVLEQEELLLCNVMRSDDNPHESGIYTETLLSAAPSREGNYVKVKKIL
ncbi:MAG: Asp-tRNA(Asn)/Glu-tRNA(Gln) amidotransferase subunit GatC [bacterium]|nr:Asp-tRNA(Asn)/Glu-tRNA(Gln) amidotransferase subunit GatC [bacterium]